MKALAPMIRLAKPPAPDSDGGLTNQTIIPVTNAAIAKADPARFRGIRARVWPLENAFERDSLVRTAAGHQPAGRDVAHDLPVAGHRGAASTVGGDLRSLRVLRQPLDFDGSHGGLPRPGTAVRHRLHGARPHDADADRAPVASSRDGAGSDRLLRLELQGLERSFLSREGLSDEPLARVLRTRVPHGRDQLDLLPACQPRRGRTLDHAGARGVRLRAEDQPLHHAHEAADRHGGGGRALLRADRTAGRVAEDGAGSVAAP